MKTQPAKLELRHLAPYLPYGLNILRDGKVMELTALDKPYKTNDDYFVRGETKIINGTYKQTTSFRVGQKDLHKFKPILRPMSDLTKEIQHEHQSYAFVDLFEIGDEGGFNYEFDFGNIKTIQNLKTIAKYGNVHDINYLPFAVVQLMFEYHFDVFGLIPAGLAIDVNSIESEASNA